MPVKMKTEVSRTDMLKYRGYSFLSLQTLFDELSDDFRAYLFPGAEVTDFKSVQERIQKACFGDATHTGFIRKVCGKLYFCELLDDGGISDAHRIFESFLLLIGDKKRDEIQFRINFPSTDNGIFDDKLQSCDSLVKKSSKSRKTAPDIRWKKKEADSSILDTAIGDLFDDMDASYKELKDESATIFSKVAREEKEPDTPLDARAQAIIAELERIQKKHNISIEEFEGFLVQKVKLSHLHITPAGKIILTDFGNMEVKIDDLSKAVFFLYLKHPEGISYYDLDSYRSELMDLYLGITGKDDQESIDRSIDSLVDRFNNSINVKVSIRPDE